MMQGIFAYGGTNNRRTLLSVGVLFVASVLLVMPYYFVYRAVTVLLDGGAFSPAFIAEHALIIGGLMIVQTVLYTKGLDLSHQAAYGTLMNLRLSLAEKLEKLPLPPIALNISFSLARFSALSFLFFPCPKWACNMCKKS